MSKTTRREMLKKVGAASTVAAGLGLAPIVSRSASLDDDDNGTPNNATVSFGEWMTTPPLDRYPPPPLESPPAANHHDLVPKTAKIKAGGTVNFIIAGFHNVNVYDDGTKPGDINTTLIRPTTAPPGPAGVPLINDPTRRIYSGLDPGRHPRDRVEVVHFPNPGTYLVICGVRPHFVGGMFGFVRVLPNRNRD